MDGRGAEELSVTSELLPPDATSTLRAADLVDRARRDGMTGRVWMRLVGVDRPVMVYLHQGHVYAAERSIDPGLGVRLLVEGIVTRRQLRAGALDATGIERLGSLFDLDPTIDRDAVETFLARITAELLASIAECEVASSTLDHAHGHPNEIDQWFGIPAPVVVPVEFVAPVIPVVPAGHIVLDDLAAALITDSVLAAVDRALSAHGHATPAPVPALAA